MSPYSERYLFAQLFYFLSDPVFVVNEKNKILICNDACVETYGYTKKEFVDLNPAQVIHPDHYDQFQTTLEKTLLSATQLEESVHIRKDGSSFPVEVHSRAEVYGDETSLIVVVRDVTERKKAEGVLQERVKELNCLYGISHLVERESNELDDILQSTVDLIPSSWQYPEITCASIRLDDKEYNSDSDRCSEAVARQQSDIKVHNTEVGSVSVCYIEEKLESDEGPFLKEERNLLDAIAERLGRIIEHKKVENELKESERNLKNLMANVPIGISISNPQGQVLEINDQAIDMLGYDSKESFLRVPASAHYHNPQDREQFIELLNAGSVSDFEGQLKRKDGSLFWCVISSVKEKALDGTIQFINAFQDITERKQAEEELQQSEERYRTLSEVTTEGIIIHDDGIVIDVNERFVNMFGYRDSSELIGKNAVELLVSSPEERERMIQKIQTGNLGPYEINTKRVDGTIFPIEVRATYSKIEGKEVRVASAFDITERKKTEEVLEESEARLRASEEKLLESNQLMENILAHTHIMTVYLDNQFDFIWVNKAYADTCEYEPSFFPGKNHFELYPHEENQRIFQRAVDTGESFYIEAKPFEFPDQPERGVTYWDWSLVPVKDEAEIVTGLVFTLADVTERVRLEESK